MGQSSEIAATAAHRMDFRPVLPAAYYLFAASLFFNQLPMHEEVIHVDVTSTWEQALRYYTHPPVYALLSKAFRSLFGETYKSMYLIGVASVVIDLFLIGKILALVAKDGDAYRLSSSGMWLFAAMPIVVQGSLLLEIDNTVLPPLCLLAIWYYLKHRENLGLGRALVLGLLFGLAMWAKFFATPLLLIGAVFVYEWTVGTFLGALKRSTAVLFAALAFFVPTYLLYAHYFIPGTNTFSFLFFDKAEEGRSVISASMMAVSVSSKLAAFFFWFSPFFAVFFLYSSVRMAMRWRSFGHERLFLLGAAIIFAFYLVAHPYPFSESKYFFPVFALVAMLVPFFLRESGVEFLSPALVIVPAAALAMFLLVGDPLYELLHRYRRHQFAEAVTYAAFYAFLSIALFAAVYRLLLRYLHERSKAACTALAYLTVSAWLALIGNQAAMQYQTKYQYGEEGARETVEYVRSSLDRSSAILPGDIAYYANAALTEKSFSLEDLCAKERVWDWVIGREVNFTRMPACASERLEAEFSLVRKMGSYRAYRRWDNG